MSAFMVSKLHIDVLVRYAIEHRITFDCRDVLVQGDSSTATLLGKLLMQANAASVKHRYEGRYPDDDDANQADVDAYAYDPKTPLIGKAGACIAANCLAYQSCERDDWDASPAKAFCDAVEAHTDLSMPQATTIAETRAKASGRRLVSVWCVDPDNVGDFL